MTRIQETVGSSDSLAYLDGLVNYERSGSMTVPTLERMTALVTALGNPHRSFPVIHVTGTNGKGSTTAMIGTLLAGRGLRVGTYTSPHIERITERITVDGKPVSGAALADAVRRVEQTAQQIGVVPTWFEALTAAGLWLLAARSVDVAVIEVGMLGRWDATNVVDGTVAVVTNVQLDHTDMAGPTRAAIATEKAGIVKSASTLVLGEADPELRAIFTQRNPARILTVGREMTWRNRRTAPTGKVVDFVNPWGVREGIHVGMLGAHQSANALLALTAAEAFTGSMIPAAAVDAALTATCLPGRFEVVHSHPTVILDGAHNPAGATALRAVVDENFADVRPRVLLYGTLVGRDPVEFLEKVGAGEADLLIVTEPASPRAVPAAVLAAATRSFGVTTRTVEEPERALAAAMVGAGTDGIVIATGSLYLIGALRTAATKLVESFR